MPLRNLIVIKFHYGQKSEHMAEAEERLMAAM